MLDIRIGDEAAVLSARRQRAVFKRHLLYPQKPILTSLLVACRLHPSGRSNPGFHSLSSRRSKASLGPPDLTSHTSKPCSPTDAVLPLALAHANLVRISRLPQLCKLLLFLVFVSDTLAYGMLKHGSLPSCIKICSRSTSGNGPDLLDFGSLHFHGSWPSSL